MRNWKKIFADKGLIFLIYKGFLKIEGKQI